MRTGLALPPDSSETFVREVGENLRRDQARDFARTYGKWVVAGVLLVLLAIGGFLYWKDRQVQSAERDVEQLVQTLTDVGAGKEAAASAELDTLAKSDSDGVEAVAKLTRAALALQRGDRAAASKIYAELAADKGIAQPFRDVALLRGTALDYDRLKPADVVARLQPLVVPGNAFYGSAGELTGMAMLAQNRRSEAARLFASIAADKSVPDTLRDRAVQIAGSLGIDASASVPSLSTAPVQ